MLLLVGAIFGAVVVTAIRLPIPFPLCFRDDPLISKCVVKAAKSLKPHLRSGIEELEIPHLYQLTVPEITVSILDNNSHFEKTVHNLTFIDMDTFKLRKVEFRPEDVTLEGNIKYKSLLYSEFFNMTGYVLGVPVNGARFFEGRMEGFDGRFVIKGEIFKKGGVDRCKVSDVKFDLQLQQIYGTLNAEKTEEFAVDDEFVYEYSKEVAKVFQLLYGQIFQTFLRKYLIKLCEDVPYSIVCYFPTSLSGSNNVPLW
ncbi:hypothetical protein RI129_004353 [Pyrocoelia pectoralis]|uniref:Juvenile hormone binding protein n=1 Tax=Pyrocoelia pectoralis TaxID=417401 RepID=A0AAN7VL99_9COLE